MKRPKADTAEAALRAMSNAAKGPIQVPKHVTLRELDGPFWEGIVRARARDEWTDADLVVAAQLARCQQDIEAESKVLDGEGTVVMNERGTPVCNPRVSVLEQLARREMALMRSLRMTGRVAGDSRNQDGMRRLERQALQTHRELEAEDDGLLAM